MRSLVVGMLAALVVFGAAQSPAQETKATTTPDAAKGVPALQEVEATGTGSTENEAFKQAVVDAVRQVVGTLVSAENVIKNDRVIKDEVLTLSNGFVEKVLNQDKTKMDDGTWQMKLKCIVRKGQLYGNLQKARVPTIKFDGVSMFADVVSQLDHQKSSVDMIQNALRTFSPRLVSASISDEKPKIVERNDRETEIEITWRASVNVDSFFKDCAPLLDSAFSGAAAAKAKKLVFSRNKQSKDSGITFGGVYGNDIDFGKGFDIRDGGTLGLVAVPIANQTTKWGISVNRIDRRILEQLPRRLPPIFVVCRFRDASGDVLGEFLLTSLEFCTLCGQYNYVGNDFPCHFWSSYVPLLQSDFDGAVSSMNSSDYSDFALPKLRALKTEWLSNNNVINSRTAPGSSILNHRSRVRVPTQSLSRISKVELTVETKESAEQGKRGAGNEDFGPQNDKSTRSRQAK